MLRFRYIGCAAIAAVFALALAIDAADARRGGGGGMRAGGGFSGGGGMRGGGFSGGGMRSGGGAAIRAGGGRAHVSHPIARPGGGWANRPGNRPPGWANRPGYNPGWGYRPGYGWGAAAAVGAGLAASSYYDPYDYSGYGYYDGGAYAEPSDAIEECARRFRTYDRASQTYVVRKGVRASCP